MKTVWFLNHYAMPPEFEQRTRTNMFAHHLNQKGYSTKIFAASTLHNHNRNLIVDGSQYVVKQYDDLEFVHINCPNYQGNGSHRVYNLFAFVHKFPIVAQNFSPPDVIVACLNCLTFMPVVRYCKRNNVRLIVDVRDLWPLSFIDYINISPRNPVVKFLYYREKVIYSKADHVIFTMEGWQDYVSEKGWDREHQGPIDLKKTSYISNGVDLEAFRYNQEHFRKPDEHLDNPDCFTAVYVGSIRTANHVDLLVDAAKRTDTPNIRYLIWGSGDHLDALKKRCSDEKVSNIMFKGQVPKREIPSIITRADVNVLCGQNAQVLMYGGSLNKMFDSLAAGKPIVQNFSMGFSIINRYQCGVIVENSGETTANAVMQFEKMPSAEYMAYCRNAVRAAEEYDFKMLSEKLIRILDKR